MSLLEHQASWAQFLKNCEYQIKAPVLTVEGKLVRMVGLTLEAVGCQAPIGSRCIVKGTHNSDIEAEVVGFSGDKLYLMATGDVRGVLPGARVIPSEQVFGVPVGDALLGRVLSGTGEPLDGLGPLKGGMRVANNSRSINPLNRKPVNETLDVGVRAINALFSVGRGQRMGLFAGSGVGKTVLLGMMSRFTTADVTVVGLIGERRREVKEFIQNFLGDTGLRRAVVVAAPADDAPVARLHGASLATRIAEYFRDQGMNVLLLMDSLTRYAQAQREIALAIGEPPAANGYPPSVFAKLPKLVERAGNGDVGCGSITAFYSVLMEDDDTNDPIADAARAILDGQIVLSRDLAEAGHYPAIDVEASISRAMTEISKAQHIKVAREFKRLYTVYRQNHNLISVGAYQSGSSPEIDDAIGMYPFLTSFLQQDMHQSVSLQSSISMLQAIVAKRQEQEKSVTPTPRDTQLPSQA